MKVNKRVVVYMSLITVSLSLLGLFVSDITHGHEDNEKTQTTEKSHKKDSSVDMINVLFDKEDADFLSASITQEKINHEKNKVSQLDNTKQKSTLLKKIELVQKKFDKQNFLNGLYEKKVLKGNKMDKKSAVKADKLLKEQEQTINNLSKEMTKEPKDHFYKKVNELLNDANQQISDVKALQNMIKDIKENKDSQVTKEQKEQLDSMVTKIRNQQVKKDFDKEVATFKLVSKEELKQTEEKVKEEKNKKNEENKQVGQSTENNAQSGNNSSNGGSASQQGGIEGIVASSPTAQQTNQIVGVVASGSSAQVYLFEKNGASWQVVTQTSGHVGSQGVGQASEYVSRTPKGSYGLGFAFGTSNPGTQLPFRAITPNSYWISNVNDPQYNTWQERPSSDSADEHLADYPAQYQYAITINYSAGVGGGSAFFLHCDNGSATAGCVSVPTGVMQSLMQRIHFGARIVNVNSVNELANY